MILVPTASAAARLVVEQTGSDLVRRLWDEPVTWLAPTTLVPEVATVITAAHGAGQLRGTVLEDVQGQWRSLADEIDLHVVDADLALAAGVVAEDQAVPHADAIYIALAQAMAPRSEVLLVSFDGRQRGAALATGVDVVPAGRGPLSPGR